MMKASRQGDQSPPLTTTNIDTRTLGDLPEVLPLNGSALDGVRAVIKRIQESLENDQQIVLRGGAQQEGLGWLSTGPFGDPRVSPDRSLYTRRTGRDIPAYELTGLSDYHLTKVIEDAARYARSGNLMQQLSEHLGQPAQRADLLSLDPDNLPFQLNRSEGILAVFSDEAAAYLPTFHRKDVNWNQGNSSYNYAVAMPEGSRNLRALIPTPKLDGIFPDGAFAVMVTPWIEQMSENKKAQIFHAAFNEIDLLSYEKARTTN